MKEMRVKLTMTEPILGTASNDKEIHRNFIASHAQDALTMEEEVEAVGVDEMVERGMTVFPRNEEGKPIFWDYQIKGFCKDACGMLRKVSGTHSSKLKAYKKEIDGLIFVRERKIPICYSGEMQTLQRPLRAQTAQGERVSLANSEMIAVGATLEFTIVCIKDDLMASVEEWLEYGALRGLGQWRNAGFGRFSWEKL